MPSEDHSASTIFPNTLPDPSVNSPEWLEQILKEKCHVPLLREFQLKPAIQLNDGMNLFLVVATGQGKTLVMYFGIPGWPLEEEIPSYSVQLIHPDDFSVAKESLMLVIFINYRR
ncbi:hypothetical protein IW261DRAFT_1619689 [Armillaria novae-zelandiae]|uniref:DEAD/DEAH box helicase domain-containing protein n=1 Tax=Armillaria novae-zelandiae TaxID=153914 RepID=A0AA39PWF9_9AGAR|nr:hypothetical protein IW261DRAFT_1619689 [Armillaria novae-zelandiae]